MSVQGWKTETRSHGCANCGAPTEVTILVQARESKRPRATLQTTSLTFCNKHAQVVFANCERALQKRGKR